MVAIAYAYALTWTSDLAASDETVVISWVRPWPAELRRRPTVIQPTSSRKKTSIGFTVVGDWAFERYEYKSTDVDKKTGAVTTDKGKGINIFRRGTDGKWRVAVDGWSSDIPIAK